MKSKKHILALLLAAVMLLGLCACGDASTANVLKPDDPKASEPVKTPPDVQTYEPPAEPDIPVVDPVRQTDVGTDENIPADAPVLDEIYDEGAPAANDPPMEEGGLGEIPDGFVPLSAGPALPIILEPTHPGTAGQRNSSASIDYSNTKDGYIMCCWHAGGSAKIKVLVKGPSGTTYTYDLKNTGVWETFPLSDGNGSYTVGVYQNVSGTQYATILTASFAVTLSDQFAPFLRPNQYVNYTATSAAVTKASELVTGKTTNLEKVGAVYKFVVDNITYDTVKAQTVQSGYLPNIDNTLNTKKGICFDYASLMAAMLRSQGVPVKLVIGYTGTAYHAWLNVWSETEGWVSGYVFFDGTTWKIMDPTFASSSKESESIKKYIGNGANYAAKFLY